MIMHIIAVWFMIPQEGGGNVQVKRISIPSFAQKKAHGWPRIVRGLASDVMICTAAHDISGESPWRAISAGKLLSILTMERSTTFLLIASTSTKPAIHGE